MTPPTNATGSFIADLRIGSGIIELTRASTGDSVIWIDVLIGERPSLDFLAWISHAWRAVELGLEDRGRERDARPRERTLMHCICLMCDPMPTKCTRKFQPRASFFALGWSNSAIFKNAMQCSICLNSLDPSESCYLLPACYHCFHEICLERWTHQQLQHPQTVGYNTSHEGPVSCPICRATYTAFLCISGEGTYQITKVSKLADEMDDLIQALTELKEDELRRRMFLMQLRGQERERTPRGADAGTESGALGPRSHQRSPPRRSPDDPAVAKWVERDLVSLLLHRQVGIMVQLTLQIMRVSGNISMVASELRPFLGNDLASLFAAELDRFMASRLNIQAYDAQQRNELEKDSSGQKIDEQSYPLEEDSDFLNHERNCDV